MKRSALALLIALTLGLGAAFVATSLFSSSAVATGSYSPPSNGN